MNNHLLMIAPPLLRQLLDKPEQLREPAQLINIKRHADLPTSGANLFVHLTARCPVQCRHCMYGSVPNPSLLKSDLSTSDLEQLIQYIHESNSAKLTISGGGEPFLRLNYVRTLLEQANTPEIEIITSANWAKTRTGTNKIITSLLAAASVNKNKPKLAMRLSLDSYHLEAVLPIQITNYVYVVEHWIKSNHAYELSIRSLDSDQGSIQLLAKVLKCKHKVTADGEYICTELGPLHIARNILKFSGAASHFGEEERVGTGSMFHVFSDFLSVGSQSLSRTLNVNRSNHYIEHEGVSITIDSDGSIRLFGASAPDVTPNLSTHRFAQSLDCFYKDLLTHALLHFGLSWLLATVYKVSPATIGKVLSQNDLTRVVHDSLSDSNILAYVRLKALFDLVSKNLIDIEFSDEWKEVEAFIEGPAFLNALSEAVL